LFQGVKPNTGNEIKCSGDVAATFDNLNLLHMAAARAEARRKAILSRGTDRLAKLTSSARGEDAPAYLHDGLPFLHPFLFLEFHQIEIFRSTTSEFPKYRCWQFLG